MAHGNTDLVTPAQRAELREAGYGVWQDHGTWSWACLFGGAAHGAQGYTSEPEAWLGAAEHFLRRRERVERGNRDGHAGAQAGACARVSGTAREAS